MYSYLIHIVFAVLLTILSFSSNSQVPPPAPVSNPFNSARLIITSGGSVNFVFNTIDEIMNGKILDAGPPDLSTLIGIELQNDASSVTSPSSWDLFIEMDGDLIGTGGNTLSSETIEVECVDNSGGAIPGVSFISGYHAIPTSPAQLRIINSGPPGDAFTNKIRLNFRCGHFLNTHPLAEKLSYKDPGFYSGTLVLTLEPDF